MRSVIVMPRKGENIYKRKDGRWEARYIKGYGEDGKAVYGYVFGKSYLETKRKRNDSATSLTLPVLSALPLHSLLSSAVPTEISSAVAAVPTVPTVTQIFQVGEIANNINNFLVINRRADGASDRDNDAATRSPLLADIALQWIESLISIRKKSTVVKYAGQLKNYILPTFGDKRLLDITTADLMGFSRWLLDSGRKDGKNGGHLSPRTVINILAEMKSIKKFASLHGYDVRYATECVEVPKQPAIQTCQLTNNLGGVGYSADHQGIAEQPQGRNQKKVLTVEEQKKLMSYLKETMKETMTAQAGHVDLSSFGIMLSLSTGIRLGELCALKWSDFSLEDGEFRIQRTMQRLPVDQLPAVTTASEMSGTITSALIISDNKDDKTVGNIAIDSAIADNSEAGVRKYGKHNRKTIVRKTAVEKKTSVGKKTAVEIGTPKSHCSTRTIPIPEAIMGYIKSAYNTAKHDEDAFLLTGTREKFIEPRTMENRFKAMLKKCGLRNINFHTLRHSFATRAVELGFDVKTLSEILGHANVGITLDRYVHPSMKVKKENMDKMGEML